MAVASANRTVVGVFKSMDDAQRAFDALEKEGFSRDEISFIANKNAQHSWGGDDARTDTGETASNVAADAGIGAALGGVGGLLLSFAGLAVPGIGPVLAAGPIIAALGGAGIGAAAGGLIGALTESGIPEEQAHHYAEGVRRGDILITARTDGARSDRAAEIMDDNGAIDIDRRVEEWRERGWNKFDPSAQPLAADELRRERETHASSQDRQLSTGQPPAVSRTSPTSTSGVGVGSTALGPGVGRTEFTSGGPGVTTGTGPGRMVGTEAGMGTGPGSQRDDLSRTTAPIASAGGSSLAGKEALNAKRDAKRTSDVAEDSIGTGRRGVRNSDQEQLRRDTSEDVRIRAEQGVETVADRTEPLTEEATRKVHDAGRDTKRGAARIYEKLRG